MTTEKFRKALEDNKDNMELLKDLVREVNGYNGNLEEFEVYEFDEEFFNTFFEGKPMEAVQRAFFGNIQNWSDEYIRFDGYGNLESLTDYTYEKDLYASADEIIDEAVELFEQGNLDEDVLENNDIEVEDEE